jgi:hypothetical protein
VIHDVKIYITKSNDIFTIFISDRSFRPYMVIYVMFIFSLHLHWLIIVFSESLWRYKAWVCGCFVAGIAGSNPARGMDVCLLCLYVVLSCVGRGLWDGLITRPEESYRVSNDMWLRNLNKEEDKAQVWAIVPRGKGEKQSYLLLLYTCVC